ncbi:neutral and basic amino acid transport protein rBAT-like [Harmonia axyridis]|uniref:neutral and basic amino acid transport protein rBAT-like n=1 Tax=Harmonia axyridis TaxID=115357 RepID=UPI001E279AE9|nr:neutral and basic amino acid transport protein rBAT-like [Harmonia axyridis]
MDSYLQVDSANNMLGSPTSACIPDDVSSICPLITPSPPTNALVNPLPESQDTEYNISNELVSKLQKVKTENKEDDTTSSNSSNLAEPASVQLLNHKNNSSSFPFIINDEENLAQESNGKSQPLQLTFRNPPDNYFFMSWNWPLIRKISLWTFLAGLAAMVALVVAMIYSLPKVCNPQVEWYQGKVFYEIFPGSFYDTNNGMTGDFRGISKNADYIVALGVSVVRLNSIFETLRYPEDYKNVTSLINIAKPLGNINDFESMVNHLKSKNLSIVLDLPVYPLLKELSFDKRNIMKNLSSDESSMDFLRASNQRDPIEEALLHWTRLGVQGFYLKGLENLAEDPNLASTLRGWKRLIGFNRIFIVSESLLKRIPSEDVRESVMNNVNLIDIKLNIEKGANEITRRIYNVENSTLFTKAGNPWIHWSIGDEDTMRLANRLPHGNSTLGALLLNLMLPGSPSIFYGDEIGLRQIHDPSGDRDDLKHLHQLTPMAWPNLKQRSFSWLHGEKTKVDFEQGGLISKMASLRSASPSIYMNSVYKNEVNKANAEVKYSKEDLLVIQRWYPRRKSYVIVSNLGKNKIEEDLSTLLYRGDVIVGPRPDSLPGTISFKKIVLWPGESVVIELE